MDQIASLVNLLLAEDPDHQQNSRDLVNRAFSKLESIEEIRSQFAEYVSQLKDKNKKSSEKSNDYRQKGNLYFGRQLYEYALYYYNLAILSAPYPSEPDVVGQNDLPYAYTARSLTFSQLKAHENALFDINCALIVSELSMKFDERLELMTHKVNCLCQLRQYRNAFVVITAIIQLIPCLPIYNDIVKRFLQMRDQIPEYQTEDNCVDSTVSSNVKVVSDETRRENLDKIEEYLNVIDTYMSPDLQQTDSEAKGRTFMATNDITSGEVIGVEKCVVGITFKDFHYSHCQNCFRNLGYKWWPCKLCRNVVFCDQNCQNSAYYHSHECGFLDAIQSIGSSHQVVYRMVQMVGPHKAMALWRQKRGITRMMDKNEENYVKFVNLIEHRDKYDHKTKVLSICKSIQTVFLLDTLQEFRSSFVTTDCLKDLVVAMDEFNFKVMVNVFGVYEYPDKYRAFRGEHIGNAIALNSSFFNHSCAPNVRWIFNGRHITFVTDKAIKAGEELVISYGPQSPGMGLEERQQILKRRYFFECKCNECVRQIDSLRSQEDD